MSLRCRRCAIDSGAQTFGTEVSQLDTVYKDRGGDSDAIHLAILDIVVDFGRVGAAIECRVEARTVQSEFSGVLLKGGKIKGLLSGEEQCGVFEKLSLRVGCVCRFRRLARVLVPVQGKISDHESNLVAIRFQ